MCHAEADRKQVESVDQRQRRSNAVFAGLRLLTLGITTIVQAVGLAVGYLSMRAKTPWWIWFIGFIGLAAGFGIILGGFIWVENVQHFNSLAIDTSGNIHQAEYKETYDTLNNTHSQSCTVSVAFVTLDGNNVIFTQTFGMNVEGLSYDDDARETCQSKIGRIVRVAYDRQNPANAVIGRNKDLVLPFAVLIAGAGLFVFSIIGMIASVVVRRDQTSPN